MRRALKITILLVVFTVLSMAAVAWAEVFTAVRLPYDGGWYRGEAIYRVATALERSNRFESGYYAIYAATGRPGTTYSFGLRFEDELNRKVKVTLYDRWPLDAAAKPYDLPMGPVLKGQKNTLRYRWRFRLSPRSPEGDLFILVEAHTRGELRRAAFRHRVQLLSPAVEPKDLLGRGVTYLRGPQNFMLAAENQTDGEIYQVLIPADEAYRRRMLVAGQGQIPGDLIRNGDFQAGLLHWQRMTRDETRSSGFSLGPNGLRLQSKEEDFRAGLYQKLYADVRDARSLWLEIGFRILAETAGGACDTDTPVFVTICYEDRQGKAHCADRAFRRAWTTLPLRAGCPEKKRVRKGRWEYLTEDLTRLSPPPAIIRTLSIAGGGPIGRDAEIREIHLVKRGGDEW